MAVGDVAELVPAPASGRVFSTSATVRFGDTGPDRRLRLDALARILQDAGNDDFLDAGLDPLSPWLARRAVVVAEGWPRLGEPLALTTWCGGTGGRWAERRSTLVGTAGARVEAATLWVHVDAEGRPARLPPWFLDTYAAAAGGRTVGTRLRLGAPPPGAAARPWVVRWSDLDAFGHVNNAVVWAAVEDECARHDIVPVAAEAEFPGPLLRGREVVLLSSPGPDGIDLWLESAGAVRVAVRVAGQRNTALRQ